MTSSLIYIVQSTPWVVAGLLVGFFVGRSTVAASVIIEAAQDEGDDMRESSAPKKKRVRVTSNGVIAALLIVLGIATAVQASVQSGVNEQQNQANARQDACQTAYANGFADALEARSKATAEAQDAVDELWATVAAIMQSPEGREEFRVALDKYLTKRADAKKAQTENPFPPAPRDMCKEE